MLTSASLPGGYWHEGKCYREATLRPLTGADESFLVEENRSLPSAQRVTALLSRCLQSLGPLRRVTGAAVRSLTVGDRDALILQLRRLAFGNRLDCLLSCCACGERLDLELTVDELLLPPIPDRQEWYETTLQTQEDFCRVRFRLPTGADQEAAAELATRDASAAEALLLQRCVAEVKKSDGQSKPFEAWPDTVRLEIPLQMAQLDPQAELEFRLHCPACRQSFSTLLDPAAFLIEELAARSRNLYREIHMLALHYHWSERELLSLTPSKRWLYLGLLEETFTAGGLR